MNPTIDFSVVKNIHMIGVGGIGMSGLARLFLAEGKKVSGSDKSESQITEALFSEGLKFYKTQVPENIAPGIDLVVYTDAMSADNPELKEARASGIPALNYFEALGLIANPYYQIAIAGTHGKTTTTAMTIDIFEAGHLDPSAIVGSLRNATHSNYRRGKGKYFIVEACEYRRHFLALTPTILAITNVEAEHLDYYHDLEDVISAFRELAFKVPEDGVVIVNAKDPIIKRIVDGIPATVIDYVGYLDLMHPLKLPGLHNRMNAAVAKAIAAHEKIATRTINLALARFVGTWRRFEYKGITDTGAVVYDDYGHHPSEIRATLLGARELFPGKKITVVFQPHLYSRTAQLFGDFVDALAPADRVVLADIYAAREDNPDNVTSAQMAEAIHTKNKNSQYYESFERIAKEVKEGTGEQDVILVMGAGDIWNVAELLTKKE